MIVVLVNPWLALLASSHAQAGAEPAPVTDALAYRERIALTPEAVVVVQLLDVSLAEVSAKLFAEKTIRPLHQVPISFELVYDPTEIDECKIYSVRATVRGERGGVSAGCSRFPRPNASPGWMSGWGHLGSVEHGSRSVARVD